MKQYKTVITMFIIVNVLLMALAWAFWFNPAMTELSQLQSLLRIMESRYAIKEHNKEQLESNLITLEQFSYKNQPRIIPYARLMNYMADIGVLAALCGLTENEFHAGEPVLYEADTGSQFFHRQRIMAAYEGEYENICWFVEALNEIPCYIDQITIRHSEGSFLWIQLSFVITDEN
jgi:Tfp pilus assembly protein PilO